MKPRRSSAPRSCPLAPDGTKLCKCGCGKPVGKGRRSWAGEECVERFLIANSSQHVRARLMQRDKGVCAACGRNAAEAERRWSRCKLFFFDPVRRWHERSWKPVPRWFVEKWSGWPMRHRIERAIQSRAERLKREGWPIHISTSWWEADHIVPVAEGGGQPDTLDAYRTLCWTCHRRVTAELRARLKAARSGPKP